MGCGLGYVKSSSDDVIITLWRHQVGHFWEFQDFYKLWIIAVQRLNVRWSWNFACFFICISATLVQNFTTTWLKRHAQHACKVCTCTDLSNYANFKELLYKDLLSVWSENLRICLHVVELLPYGKLGCSAGRCAMHVQSNFRASSIRNF